MPYIEGEEADKLLNFDRESRAKTDVKRREIEQAIKSLFEIEFKNVNKFNILQLSDKLFSLIETMTTFIYELDNETAKQLREKNRYKQIGLEQNLNRDHVYFRALEYGEEAVRKQWESIGWRSMGAQTLLQLISKMKKIIEEQKGMEIELTKMEAEKNLYNIVIEKMNQNNKELLEQMKQQSNSQEQRIERLLKQEIDRNTSLMNIIMQTKEKKVSPFEQPRDIPKEPIESPPPRKEKRIKEYVKEKPEEELEEEKLEVEASEETDPSLSNEDLKAMIGMPVKERIQYILKRYPNVTEPENIFKLAKVTNMYNNIIILKKLLDEQDRDLNVETSKA